jgi:GT2 family glycosyltransferase
VFEGRTTSFLTVGILNFNAAAMTVQLLDQLVELSEAGWDIQLIVVDNGSAKNAFQHLSDWFVSNRHQFVESIVVGASHNLGCAGGRNVILKLAAGEAFLFLDNDIILPDGPEWLATLWQDLQSDPDIAIVGPMLVFSDYPEIVQAAGSGLTVRGRVGYLHRGEPVQTVPEMPVQVGLSPSACWLVRPEAHRAIGLFSEEFDPAQYEDVDFCVRLRLEGWRIVCDRSVRVAHKEHATTKNIPSHPFERLNARNAMRFREKWANVLPEMATIQQKDICSRPKAKKVRHILDGLAVDPPVTASVDEDTYADQLTKMELLDWVHIGYEPQWPQMSGMEYISDSLQC